jgi:3-deoxy-7-phosphoheptulonate synthase
MVMILVLEAGIGEMELDEVRQRVESLGVRTYLSRSGGRALLGCIGEEREVRALAGGALPRVEAVVAQKTPYKLVARAFAEGGSVVPVGEGGALIGGRELAVIAGPCSVEGRDMLLTTARSVRGAGAGLLRGGAFKPRSSPYAFQGLGAEALELLAEARRETGLPVVTEVLDPRQVELVASHADVLQVGARNMQNFALLAELGHARRPVLLKRGLSATVQELLLAAEYIVSRGNRDVILCERGIRTYETATRNTLDIAAIPVLKRETHLPVIVDPSHAGGRAELVLPLALAAIVAGADGLIVEVHPEPSAAWSDGEQSLSLEAFAVLMQSAAPVAAAVGRTLQGPDAGREEWAA